MAGNDNSCPKGNGTVVVDREEGLNDRPLELELGANELIWDGPNDPDNPRNWALWNRIFHTSIPALWSFGLCVGVSSLVAAVPLLEERFDVSRNVALLPVSLYTIGFSLGPCIASPISEMYGRRCIYWTNFPMLCVFNAIAGAADNFPVLVIFRFLAGVGGSGVLAVAAGSLSDVWDTRDAGRVGVVYIMAPFLGPSLGPLIGAYTLDMYDNDWRWSIWVILCILAPVAIMIPFMKETSQSRILSLRLRKKGQGVDMTTASRINKISAGLWRPFHMTIIEPLTLLLGIYTSFSFAMIFSFFGSYAYLYTTVYKFNLKEVGLCYIPVVVGFIFAVVTFGVFDAIKYQKEVVRTKGHPCPELRLYSALLGSFLVPIGLFWYAWAPRQGVHWVVPAIAGLFVGWGTLTGFLATIAYIVDVYGSANSASAVAANGMIRFALAAAFPQFIIQLYKSKMGIHWAGSIFAFIGVLTIPVPWLLFYYGGKFRRQSHYPTNKD